MILIMKTSEHRTNYMKRFARFQKNRERMFAPMIYRVIRSQYQTVIDHAHLGMSAVNKIESHGVAVLLKKIYLDAAIVYGAKIRSELVRLKARMPIGFSERMSELIEQYFKTDILNLSEHITETTKDLIRKVFTDAYEQGLGIDDIIAQLQDTELSKTRARLIARTETMTAANQGAMFVAQDTGLKLNKIWLATADNRTRHTHRVIDGHKVGLDDYFILPDNVKMLQPGDKGGTDGRPDTPARDLCNCRCCVLFEPVRENGKLVMAA